MKLASPVERLDLVLLGVAKESTATVLCQQAGVSRELFYRWMGLVRGAALKALEAGKPGPKPERELEEEAKRLAEKVERLTRENAQLRQERSRLKLVLGAAKRIIQRHAWGSDDKKKGCR
jgi:transposase-like protein